MKPERDVEFCDMDMVVKDPRSVLEEIGLLILEGRTPDPSVKGRKEGSHCATIHEGSHHSCQQESKECSLATEVKSHMNCAWQNSVPTYIDIFLLPDCKHGQLAANTVEGSVSSLKEDHILLERWYIEFMKKRHEKIEGSVSSSFLVQALRSYLHFSQLSSWLLSTGGSLALSVVYRLSAPGEGVLYPFVKIPDVHIFPKAEFIDVGLCLSVESLSRQDEIPKLFCEDSIRNGPSETCPLGRKGRISQKKQPDSKNKDPLIDKESSTRKNYLDKVYHPFEPSTKTKRHSKPEPKKDSKTSEVDCGCVNSAVLFSSKPGGIWRRSPSPTTGANSNSPNFQSNTDSVPSCQQHVLRNPENVRNRRKSPSRQIFKENLLPLNQEYESHNLQIADVTTKRLHSPKILLASATETKVEYTKRKRLNLDSADDGLSWEKDYLSSKINPVDINEYITNLQNYSISRSSSDNSSGENTPRCKFYIGECCDHTTCTTSTNTDEITLKRQRERNRSFEEVPRKLFAPCLSDGSDEIQPTIRTNPSEHFFHERETDEQCKNGFHKTSISEKSENRFINGHTCDVEEENGLQNVTEMLDNITVDDDSAVKHDQVDSSNIFFDSGLHIEEVICDKELLETSHIDLHDSCFDKSHSLSDTQFLVQKCDTDFADTKLKHNSPKRAFSVPNYSSDNEVAVTNGFSLCKSENTATPISMSKVLTSPTMEDILSFRRHLTKSASMMFNQRTGLPSQSSPAPTKRKSGRFDYDSSLTDTKAIKYALSCSKLDLTSEADGDQILEESGRVLSTSAPASTNCLLGNFEESILNGRIEPIGAVDGFTAEIGASGSFCPKHIALPVSAYFFNLSDDNAPSPYLGHINLETLGKRGYHIPKRGTVQVTLFNPNKTVVKMFVVMYDMTDMPPRCQTFIRQRTLYMPVDNDSDQPSYLRYLIHLRFASTKSSKVYLHTDLRLLFARDKFEFDIKVAQYELRSFTEGPTKPKYSPKR